MVKIYYCKAENFEHCYEKALPLLTEKRREKTERYLKKEDKLLSLMSGLMLKKLLGLNYESDLSYTENGKPYIEHGPCFNLSHSKNIAVIAISESNMGVDIEIREDISKGVIDRCFTEEEKAFASLSTENALRIWTAKEAVLKLLGTGFSLSPKTFSVMPLEKEREINGVKLKFICIEIENNPVTIAYEGENKDFEISELTPKDFIH